MGDIQKGDCAKCGAGPLGNCGFHGCETPRNTCPLRPHLSIPALPEPQVGEGEGIDKTELQTAKWRTQDVAAAIERFVAGKSPFGYGDMDVADRDAKALRILLASHEAQRAEIKALKEGLRLTKERIQSWPLDDQETCMCGSPVEGHSIGSGHSPVSQGDHAISMLVKSIDDLLVAFPPAEDWAPSAELIYAVNQWTDEHPPHPDLGYSDTETAELCKIIRARTLTQGGTGQ